MTEDGSFAIVWSFVVVMATVTLISLSYINCGTVEKICAGRHHGEKIERCFEALAKVRALDD